jgi:hypothetical protein
VTSPCDGNFVGLLDTRHFHFDEVFFDSVAEVQVGLVGVVLWPRVSARKVLNERLMLMVALMGVVHERGRVIIVLQKRQMPSRIHLKLREWTGRPLVAR